MGVLSKVLIPLFLAIIFALIFQPIISYLRKIRVPIAIILPFVYVLTIGGVYLVSSVVYNTVSDITVELPYLTEKFNEKLTSIVKVYNQITGSNFRSNNFFDKIIGTLDYGTITSYAGKLASNLTSFTSDFIMFALYYFLLLAGIPRYRDYIRFVGGKNGDTFLSNYETIQKAIVNYMLSKFLVNLVLGTLVFLICTFFGIKFALFWGFLMLLLHFIPTIGSILASIPPILLAMLQFDTWSPIIIMASALIGVQFIVGNILEPKFMGKQLKINTVTVLVGLVFWGQLWGIIGMLLSVPLMVLIKLILEKIPDLSFLSRIMGSPDKKSKNKNTNETASLAN